MIFFQFLVVFFHRRFNKIQRNEKNLIYKIEAQKPNFLRCFNLKLLLRDKIRHIRWFKVVLIGQVLLPVRSSDSNLFLYSGLFTNLSHCSCASRQVSLHQLQCVIWPENMKKSMPFFSFWTMTKNKRVNSFCFIHNLYRPNIFQFGKLYKHSSHQPNGLHHHHCN